MRGWRGEDGGIWEMDVYSWRAREVWESVRAVMRREGRVGSGEGEGEGDGQRDDDEGSSGWGESSLSS